MTTGIKDGNVQGIYITRITINPASVATITTAEQTFTVPGVKVGDFIFVSKPSLTAGLGVSTARASAADTIAITFVNPTAGAIDAASEVWLVMVARPEVTPDLDAALKA